MYPDDEPIPGGGGFDALIAPDDKQYTDPSIPPQGMPQRVTRLSSEPLYSAYRWPAGAIVAGQYAVFVTALNGTGQGFPNPITELHTNLSAPGQTPSGDAYLVDSIGVAMAIENNYLDFQNIQRHCWLEVRKKDYRRSLGPIMFWPGGVGAQGPAMTTNPAVQMVELSNGIASAGALRQLDPEMEIASGENFRFIFHLEDYLAAGLTNLNAELIMYVVLYTKKASIVAG